MYNVCIADLPCTLFLPMTAQGVDVQLYILCAAAAWQTRMAAMMSMVESLLTLAITFDFKTFESRFKGCILYYSLDINISHCI